MKTRLSLAKEGHAFSCISKRLKKVPKTCLYLPKRQHNPQRTHLPPAVPAKRELPWDLRWRRCSVAKQPKQLLRTLISCVLLPALTLPYLHPTYTLPIPCLYPSYTLPGTQTFEILSTVGNNSGKNSTCVH
jgi:hypothetical protein